MREINRTLSKAVPVAVVLMLAACAAPRPPMPAPGEDRVVEERVRAPSAGSGEELQVFGVRNPAVTALGREAAQVEKAGELERAEMLLERALRIDGRDPAILQQMAELQLARGRLDQAANYAQRSFELGPQVGEICQRSLRTLIVVHERAAAWEEARKARDRLADCRVAPPERF
ncbi:MAG TPA: tetratricopeptide repeat protein [Wenzhouxiangellaceae bacterium]|nr:tetratricopeptide repeat protein [Wenzhouxiangellaceae bacterium]